MMLLANLWYCLAFFLCGVICTLLLFVCDTEEICTDFVFDDSRRFMIINNCFQLVIGKKLDWKVIRNYHIGVALLCIQQILRKSLVHRGVLLIISGPCIPQS